MWQSCWPSQYPVVIVFVTTGLFAQIMGFLTNLCGKFSPLNKHWFWHNFESIIPICLCNSGIEENKHFLLHCPIYYQMPNDLLDLLSEIPGL